MQGDGCHIGYYTTAKKAVIAAERHITGAGLTVSGSQVKIAISVLKQKGQYEYSLLATEAENQYDEKRSAKVCKRFLD